SRLRAAGTEHTPGLDGVGAPLSRAGALPGGRRVRALAPCVRIVGRGARALGGDVRLARVRPGRARRGGRALRARLHLRRREIGTAPATGWRPGRPVSSRPATARSAAAAAAWER